MNHTLNDLLKRYEEIAAKPDRAIEAAHIEQTIEAACLKMRQISRGNTVPIDCSLSVQRGDYHLKIGDLELTGKTAQFCTEPDPKTIHCRYGPNCRSWRREGTCRYRHPTEAPLLRQNERSFLMQTFLSCPEDLLGELYRTHPMLEHELKAFKERLLDGIIRLLWLRSEGVPI